MRKNGLVSIITVITCALLLSGFTFPVNAVYAKSGSSCLIGAASQSDLNTSTTPKHSADRGDISSPVEARKGVVRIVAMNDATSPTSFGMGSGFGVGVVGEETAIFVTNRHVVMDESTGKIAKHIYIMLDENALKQVYTEFGGFYNEELKQNYKLVVDPSRLVECEVLYPTNSDPEYPDFAILRAAWKIDNRVALQLCSTNDIEDASTVWTIGYPASADIIYSLSSNGKEMCYPASPNDAQLFNGSISRRGSLKNFGNTMALTHGAQIDHGNSGGPLVNEYGQVVGINTYRFGSETTSVGYYLSIYTDYVMDKLKELNIPFNLAKSEADKKALQALEGGNPSAKPASIAAGRPAPAEGKVTVSLETMQLDFSREGELESYCLYEYNRFGDLIQIKKYNPEGNLVYRDVLTRNEQGKKIKDETYNSDGIKEKWDESAYDSYGNEVKYRSYDKDGVLVAWADLICENGTRKFEEFHYSTSSVRYTYYNDQGKTIKSVEYEDNKVVAEKEYTDDGVQVSSKKYYDDGKIKEIETYNSIGELESDIEYDEDGAIKKESRYTYDENGNKLSRAYYSRSSMPPLLADLVRYDSYTYNDNGDILVEAEYDENKSLLSHTEYEYTENGFFSAKYDENGELETLTRYVEDDFGCGTKEYDKNGNVTGGAFWTYDYDVDGYKTNEKFFSNNVIRSESVYEVVDVDVNPNKPEDS